MRYYLVFLVLSLHTKWFTKVSDQAEEKEVINRNMICKETEEGKMIRQRFGILKKFVEHSMYFNKFDTLN